MEVNRTAQNVSPTTATATKAEDFVDPAFLPPPPFISPDESQEDEDDTRMQAIPPASNN